MGESGGGARDMMSCCRWRRCGLIILIATLFLSFSGNSHAQDCETNCATSCDENDKCVCLLPDPDSVMNGDRGFLGGVFCDTPSTMCDGTSSFWCESGGTCNEIVQGENYTCSCASGFSGVHCQDRGLVCGDSFCFNGGLCNSVNSTCSCPPELRGAPDCSLPTALAPDVKNPVFEEHHAGEWYRPLLIVLAVVGVSVCLGSVLFRWHKKRAENLSRTRFQELRQVQMVEGPDFFDDGEDDPFADTPKAASAYKLGP
ncbi:hypothetical protein R1sor_011314 [Riccia sorocarpa]|uniref:EGF-like domain-containing protein n=1 Tax=Riccia sorocarpa TaxID=122646 RepID=A0ABD3I0X3_9MARC